MTDLTFQIFGKDVTATKTLGKVAGAADKTKAALGGVARGIGTTAKAIGAAGAALGAGLTIFAKGAIDEAREAQKVGATTAAIIKSTGGAAKVTTDQIGKLAERLSVKAGVDDEVIQTGANLLLTFKNVRNEVGKGNQIFDRATEAALNLSAAGFGSVDNASKMLGKALNDPIKGISALGRAGVTFTEGQKKQIKALVDSGKTLDAQKIILKEVESQVGGVAAAQATAGDKAKVAWGNFKEAIGTQALPVIDMLANAFVKTLPKVQGFAEGILKRVKPALDQVGPLVGKVRDAFKVLFEADPDASQGFAEIIDNILGNTGRLVPVFRTIGEVIRNGILGVKAFFMSLKDGDVTSDGFVGAMEEIGSTVRDVFHAAGPIVKEAVGNLMDLGRVAAPLVQKAFGIIGDVVVKVIQVVGPIINQIRATLISAFKEAAPQISRTMDTIRTIIMDVLSIIQIAWQRLGPVILPVLKTVFGTIINVVSNVLKAVSGVIKLVLSVIKGDWSGAWNAIKQIFSGVWGAIKGLVTGALSALKIIWSGALGAVKGTWEKVWGGVRGFFSRAWEGVKGAVRDATRWVVDKFLAFGQTIINTAAHIFGWVPGIGPKLKEAARKFGTFRNDVNRALGGIDDRTISLHAKLGLSPASSRVILEKGRAMGGLIPGAPSKKDNRIMPVATGEYVVNAEQTRKHLPLLEAINSGKAQGFAKGGLNVSTAFSGHKTIAKEAAAAYQKFAQANISKVLANVDVFGGYRGGRGVERWRNVALQALALTGSPLSWIGSLLRRMNQESGGNPSIVNKWDSNWKRGTPSVGLMQVIGPTFRAYAGRMRNVGPFLYGTSINPLANIYAAIRYTVSRYGSGPAGWNRKGGYDNGGELKPGWTMAFNGTGKPELVVPRRNAAPKLESQPIQLVNYGVIASQREAEDWLARGLDNLQRQGRLPKAAA